MKPTTTPGPWAATEEAHGWAYVTSAGSAYPGNVATCWQQPGSVALANARLMAAAPELLAALRSFASLPSDTPPPGILPSAWREALAAAEDALAKAEERHD